MIYIDFDILKKALVLMGQGMLGIFIVIGLVTLVVILLTKIDKNKKEK